MCVHVVLMYYKSDVLENATIAFVKKNLTSSKICKLLPARDTVLICLNFTHFPGCDGDCRIDDLKV